MSVITDITNNKKGRKGIWIDGSFAFSLHPAAVSEFCIVKGDDVEEERLSAALARSRELEATNRALGLLSARNYTSGRLKEKLSANGQEAAQAATNRMIELRLVDDDDYAARCAELLYNTKSYAPRRIRQALMQRGVPADVAQRTAEELGDEDNPKRAYEYLKRKYPDLSDKKTKNRACAALRRLGYTGDEIIVALNNAGCREEY